MDTADDTTVTVDGDTVVKIHRAGTDPHELAARLQIASASGCLLTPLSADPEAISALGGEPMAHPLAADRADTPPVPVGPIEWMATSAITLSRVRVPSATPMRKTASDQFRGESCGS